jgi:hypothetical protein
MKYITKIHCVEAVKYDGLNKSEIEALVSGQLENFVYLLDNGNLLLRDGTVHIGEWVVLDGSAKILSHDQFMALYEEANGEDLWSLFLDLYAVVCVEVNQLGERKEHHHMYQEYLSAKEYIERRA